MQLLRVDDCGNCKTSIERICQVCVGWECCRYLLNVRLPTLVLGLLTRFTGDNKNNDVIKHILPVGMLVSWYPDTHIDLSSEWISQMAGSMKQNCTSSCSWDCLWRLQDCLLRSLRNGRAIHFWMVEILKDKVLPSWVSGLRSICSTINVENLLTFWDPVLLFIKILNWHWYWIFIYWHFSFWDMEFCVECVGRSCTWIKLEQMSTKFQNGCLLKLFIIFRGQLVTASLVV